MKRTAEILYNYNAYYSVTSRVRRAENIIPINPTCDTALHWQGLQIEFCTKLSKNKLQLSIINFLFS